MTHTLSLPPSLPPLCLPLSVFCLSLSVCVYVYVCTYMCVCRHFCLCHGIYVEIKEKIIELAFSFYHMSSGNQSQVDRLSSKSLHSWTMSKFLGIINYFSHLWRLPFTYSWNILIKNLGSRNYPSLMSLHHLLLSPQKWSEVCSLLIKGHSANLSGRK